MALARIITRSQACSRELAIDLLARGYTVEIVSPDSIPDNFADLELRVEEDRGNQLVASIETHVGERSASLDFVHHLKAPMADFVRKAPGPVEAAHLSGVPTDLDDETSQSAPETAIPEALKLTANPQRVPAEPVEVIHLSGDPASLLTQPNFRRELPVELVPLKIKAGAPPAPVVPNPQRTDALGVASSHGKPPQQESERPISRPGRRPSAPAPIVKESSLSSANEVPIVPPPVIPVAMGAAVAAPSLPRKPQPRVRSTAWQWRASLASVALLALALAAGFGLRRIEKVSSQPSEVAAAAKDSDSLGEDNLVAVAAIETNSQVDQKVAGEVSTLTVSPSAVAPARTAGRKSHRAPRSSTAASTGAAVVKASIVDKTLADKPRIDQKSVVKTNVKARESRSHRDGSIAHDTVTYLDPRFKPTPKVEPVKPETRRHLPGHKQSGKVVAANSVTYLNKTPDPKPAK